MRVAPSLAAAAVAVSALAGCSSSARTATPPTTIGSAGSAGSASSTTAGSAPGGSGTQVVIGSANFPESVVLADVYADALRKAGVQATTKLNIGSREVYFKEMENGTLNVFPEYNGALLTYLKPSTSASSTADVDRALAAALPSNLEALNPSSAEDSDSITVTAAYAAAHHLSSIADLKPIEGQVTVGGPPEFATRREGLVGLEKIYGLNVKFKPLDEAGPLSVAALRDGTVQAADIFTTDPAVAKYHFVALADPAHLFAAQNVIPIVNKKVAGPAVVNTLNQVSAALSTGDLIQLVNAVVNDHIDAATVASQYVAQKHLG